MSYSFTDTPAQTRPTSVSVWAARIVNAARAGRVRHDCGLRDHDTVMRLLVAFSGGLSQKKSATSAGISEAGLRLWIDQGRKKPDGPYGPLAAIIDAIAEARRPKLPPPDVQVFTSPPPSLPSAPPPPSWEKVDPLIVHGWMARLRYADKRQQVDHTAPALMEVQHIRHAVQDEMRAAGVTELPITPPPLNLEPGASWSDIKACYCKWRRVTLQGGPTDLDVELNAASWYRRHERSVDVPELVSA